MIGNFFIPYQKKKEEGLININFVFKEKVKIILRIKTLNKYVKLLGVSHVTYGAVTSVDSSQIKQKNAKN